VFWTRRPKTRRDLVTAGDRARAKGRVKSAVAAYRKALSQHDPDDPHVHGKLAPLLAQLEDGAGAMASFRRAAAGHLQTGFLERALSIYLQARHAFPLEPEFHSEAARVHLVRGRRADAAIVLAQGGRALGRTRRPEGIEMLRCALGLQPGHVEATLALAPLLRKEGQPDEAWKLLVRIEPGLRGAALRRARWEMLRAAPGFRAGYRWIAALLTADGHRKPRPAVRAGASRRTHRGEAPENSR
jgi:tetratricopeptide (TPR) repeat protein